MKIEDGRKVYQDTEIPKELSAMVEGLIQEDRKKRRGRKVIYMMKRCAAAAAAFVIVFTAGLNTSQAFAEGAANIPVIGAIARVLTIRSYHQDEGDYNIDMEVPAIEGVASAEGAGASGNETASVDGSGKASEGASAVAAGVEGDSTAMVSSYEAASDTSFTDKVNAEIEAIVDDFTNEAKAEFEEYKEAFFATGGTEEEWGGRQMDIIVDYDVKYQQSPILSLELTTAKGWVAASEERHYYNLNVLDGTELKLSDLLGEDYIVICNAEIDRQIKEQIANDPSLSYFGYGDNELTDAGFKTIDENTDFYINSDGQVVVVFPEYSIAPGYMGFREFTVGEARL